MRVLRFRAVGRDGEAGAKEPKAMDMACIHFALHSRRRTVRGTRLP